MVKKSDLSGYEKKVIKSLLDKQPKIPDKEVLHEKIRCKIEIIEGLQNKRITETFVMTTNSLTDMISEITKKYGLNVQFIATNLYDEKIVVRRTVYTGGYDKDKDDKENFNNRMMFVDKIHTIKNDGKTLEEVCQKISHLAGASYIKQVYNSSREDMIKFLQKDIQIKT